VRRHFKDEDQPESYSKSQLVPHGEHAPRRVAKPGCWCCMGNKSLFILMPCIHNAKIQCGQYVEYFCCKTCRYRK